MHENDKKTPFFDDIFIIWASYEICDWGTFFQLEV